MIVLRFAKSTVPSLGSAPEARERWGTRRIGSPMSLVSVLARPKQGFTRVRARQKDGRRARHSHQDGGGQ